MAYRRSNGKGRRKIEPAVHEHVFSLPAGQSFLDLNQVLSIVNRRFYRQGTVNAIQSIEVQYTPSVPGTPATGVCVIQKLPNTWVMANAWRKGFETWRRLNAEATDESQSIRPRFLDFKIYADADHHAAGYPANLLPTNLGSTATAGEWVASKIVVPKTDGTDDVSNRDIIAVGPSYPGPGFSTNNAVSLIEGYAAGRALPAVKDPNMPADAASVDIVAAENWMQATFNEGTDQDHEVIEDLLTDNNIAPYPFENDGTHTDTMYPGGANQLPGMMIHDRLLITTSTIGGSDTAVGGLFPCGLVKFTTSITGGSAIVIVRTIPGHHRGYLCESMMEL